MIAAIETSNLVKTFGETRAVDGISLQIRRGSVYGLLGPNGAGKTTTIRVLTTLVKPTSGTASVLGHDVVREAALVRQKISLTGQYASVDDELSGHENLVLVGRLLGMPWRDARERATELLAAFGLGEAAKRQVRTYSGGMRRRIDVAASLVATPEVLFLDEPTSGLDPHSRNQVWDIVRRIAAKGTTVLLTTQYLEEADRLAEGLAVIDHGRLIAQGNSRDLKASVGASALHVRLVDAQEFPKAKAVITKLLGDGVLPQTDPKSISVKVADSTQASKVIASLSSGGVQIRDFAMASPSLDDVFFALTGRPAEEKKPEEAQVVPAAKARRKEAKA